MLNVLSPPGGFQFVEGQIPSSFVAHQRMFQLLFFFHCHEQYLLEEAKKGANAEAEVNQLKVELARAKEDAEKVGKERDEAVVIVAERDALINVMRVHMKMVDTEKGLNIEIASLKESVEKSGVELELVRKKAALDIEVLKNEHEAAVNAHNQAIETYQLERTQLNGEIASLQAALSESRSPRRWGVDDIPRQLKVNFLSQYLGTRESQVTCRRINVYYMTHGFSR